MAGRGGGALGPSCDNDNEPCELDDGSNDAIDAITGMVDGPATVDDVDMVAVGNAIDGAASRAPVDNRPVVDDDNNGAADGPDVAAGVGGDRNEKVGLGGSDGA